MSTSGSTPTSSATSCPVADAGELAALRTRLGEFHGGGLTDAERIDLIEELERLKATAAAMQVRVTAAFADSQAHGALAALPEAATASERRRTVAQVSRSVAGQVALARHDSPARGQRHLGLARALVRELPHTMAALTRGEVSEWRATIVARETACLSREDRTRADAELAPRLAELGDKRLGDTVRGIAQRLDPASAVRRARKAVSERRISLRPAPDTMSYLTGLLPVAQGVAVYAALKREADTLRAQGDDRSHAQLMADTLIGRVTGMAVTEKVERESIADSIARRAGTWTQQSAPSASGPDNTGTVPAIEIQLVMTDRTLFKGDDEPALLPGFGPIPASLARRLVREADRTWLRRLYTRPGSGELVAADSERRAFTGRLRGLLVLRDQTCRNAWCDAPIRHVDHIRPHRDGGTTSRDNGQGLCEACNYLKETPGWRADVIHLRGRPHTVETTTPTGHRYRSTAPPQPGARQPSLEIHLDHLLRDAA